ncbi:MAG: 50S ribosome-binding GTPase [Chloroflexi bacterium]|jgi:GTP-binding protein Era|nr:50S ribosome-binding GTPase [Chloroflexota bacterium]
MTERNKLSEFIGRQADEIRRAWDALPVSSQSDLGKALGLLPTDMKNWRALINEAAEHLRIAVGDKHQAVIVGPANSGKSTLYNTLIRSGKDRAEVSALPGTTHQAQQADAGLFAIVDTPGADTPGSAGQEERDRALATAQAGDLLIVLFDAEHGIRPPEQELYNDLVGLGRPMVVALNKIDLVGRERAAALGRAAAALGLDVSQLIPVSAKQGQGIDRLLVAVAKSEPGIVAALGAALPAYRGKLAQAVITRAASTAGAIALTPLPFADFLPLVVVQSAMVMSIARIYTYKITLARARELVATFGIGLLARSLFYELTKFGGPPGWLVGAAVAGGTTVAMGRAATVWFERGEKISGATLRRLSRSTSEGLIGRLGRSGRRRAPGRSVLQTEVEQALTEMTPGAPTEAASSASDEPPAA